MHLGVSIGGIPHLAKNERDVGHPSFVTPLAGLLRQRHRDGQRLNIGRRRSGDQRIVASNRTGADVCVGAPTASGATDGYANQEDGRQDAHSQSALQSPPLPQEADAQHATR